MVSSWTDWHDGVMGEGTLAARQYDAMAQVYATDSEDSAFNAFYERPAMLSLLGDLDGRASSSSAVAPGRSRPRSSSARRW